MTPPNANIIGLVNKRIVPIIVKPKINVGSIIVC